METATTVEETANKPCAPPARRVLLTDIDQRVAAPTPAAATAATLPRKHKRKVPYKPPNAAATSASESTTPIDKPAKPAAKHFSEMTPLEQARLKLKLRTSAMSNQRRSRPAAAAQQPPTPAPSAANGSGSAKRLSDLLGTIQSEGGGGGRPNKKTIKNIRSAFQTLLADCQTSDERDNIMNVLRQNVPTSLFSTFQSWLRVDATKKTSEAIDGQVIMEEKTTVEPKISMN